MSSQLDILALEPFFGGARRTMLEIVMRCSRHRWTLWKLPPRRIERRLVAASRWFAEQITRSEIRNIDALFTSEAMNLADLLRLLPKLAQIPSVVYFHDNQLPDPESTVETSLDMVNLNSAMAATENWFNSQYHLNAFMARAQGLVKRHPELSRHNPVTDLSSRALFVAPPVDLGAVRDLRTSEKIAREPHTILVDMRDAATAMLGAVSKELKRRAEKYKLVAIGNAGSALSGICEEVIDARDELTQVRAMHQAGVYLSLRTNVVCDDLMVMATEAGCWPVLSDSGVYPELLPPVLRPRCLHQMTGESVCECLGMAWRSEEPLDMYREDLLAEVRPFEAMRACRRIDERLEKLVGPRPTPGV